MYVRMYVYLHVGMYVCRYVYTTYVCMYVCTYVVCVYVCLYVHMYECSVHACVCAYYRCKLYSASASICVTTDSFQITVTPYDGGAKELPEFHDDFS
jgi:hypothetical protein